jgi:hypothetical protein
MEYTPDHKRVSKFRFVESTAEGPRVGLYSDWQTTDLRLSGNDRPRLPWKGVGPSPFALNQMTMRFDRGSWNSNHGFKRVWMVYDFVHSFDLIGMGQGTVHNLLGYPSRRETNGLCKESEYYWLCGAMDCGGLPTDCLEVSYSNWQVSGFRLSVRNDIPRPY